jgi:hypothetical protein
MSSNVFTQTVGLPIDHFTSAASTALNITTSTVIKGTSGRLVRVNVVVAGSTAGAANDCTTTGAAAAGNEIAAIPNTVGPIWLDWPCLSASWSCLAPGGRAPY